MDNDRTGRGLAGRGVGRGVAGRAGPAWHRFPEGGEHRGQDGGQAEQREPGDDRSGSGLFGGEAGQEQEPGPEQRPDVQRGGPRALLAIPAVVGCHVVSGSDDFMVEVVVRDLADYERVLLDQVLAIPAVTQARSTFAIRSVLSRGPVPLTHWR